MDALLSKLWREYTAITPSALALVSRLEARGDRIENDHIALRTFERPGLELERFAAFFESQGYARTGSYVFEAKCLDALSFSCPGRPRIFVSSLRVHSLSSANQAHVDALCGACEQVGDVERLLRAPPSWPSPTWAVYEALANESEYAGWLAAFGIRANHFTFSVNALKSFDSLEALNRFVLAEGLPLNGAQDPVQAIQGSPAQGLEQSSTRADRVMWTFADREAEIRSCYVEFALRHADDKGERFDGFITGSADRIFESTNR